MDETTLEDIIDLIPKPCNRVYPRKWEGLIDFTAVIINLADKPDFFIRAFVDINYGRIRYCINAGNEEVTSDYYSTVYDPHSRDYDEYPERYYVMRAYALSEYISELADSGRFKEDVCDEFYRFEKELRTFAYKESLVKRKADNEARQKAEEEAEFLQRHAEFLQRHAEAAQRRTTVAAKKVHTYLLIDTATGFYKIGRSQSPHFREQTLLSQRPTISLLWSYEKNIEAYLHKRFAEKRVRGEWFNLINDDVTLIKSINKNFVL